MSLFQNSVLRNHLKNINQTEVTQAFERYVYTPLDQASGWKGELLKELKACDYEVKSI